MLHDLKIGPAYDGFLFLEESTRNPPRLQSHHHVELELNLVIRGSVTYVLGEKRFTLPAGTLMWLFPEQEHQLVDLSSNAQTYVAVFKPPLTSKLGKRAMYAGLKELHHEEDGLLHSFLEPEAFFLVRKVMDALMEGSLDADLLNRESGYGVDSDFTYRHADPEGLNAGLSYILTQCWRYQRSAKPLDSAVVLHKSVVAALRILSEGGWNQSLSRLAARCDVSEGHLSRLFHRQIGVHLSQYRNSLRLARFWDAYRSSENRTITEAAYAAGFGSYAQFYKVFVAAHGQGPKSLAAAR